MELGKVRSSITDKRNYWGGSTKVKPSETMAESHGRLFAIARNGIIVTEEELYNAISILLEITDSNVNVFKVINNIKAEIEQPDN
jgi:hypothetical protein